MEHMPVTPAPPPAHVAPFATHWPPTQQPLALQVFAAQQA